MKKTLALILALAMVLSLAACSSSTATTETAAPAAAETTPAPAAEPAKEEAEALYGEGIWDMVLDEKGTTYGDLRKQQVLEEYTELKIICAYAGDLEVELYEDENRDIASYVSAFMTKVGRDKLMQYNISESVIKTLYVNNTIANKVYEAVTLSVDTNVSDAEARRGKYQYIFKAKYKEGDNGERIELSEEDLSTLREKVAEIRTTASGKSDFYNYALLVTDAKEAECYAGSGDFGEISATVMALADGELSPVLETTDGFYIIKCIAAFDEEATAKNKETIVLARQEARFEEMLATWKRNATVETDTEKWKSLNP